MDLVELLIVEDPLSLSTGLTVTSHLAALEGGWKPRSEAALIVKPDGGTRQPPSVCSSHISGFSIRHIASELADCGLLAGLTAEDVPIGSRILVPQALVRLLHGRRSYLARQRGMLCC